MSSLLQYRSRMTKMATCIHSDILLVCVTTSTCGSKAELTQLPTCLICDFVAVQVPSLTHLTWSRKIETQPATSSTLNAPLTAPELSTQSHPPVLELRGARNEVCNTGLGGEHLSFWTTNGHLVIQDAFVGTGYGGHRRHAELEK